MNTPGRLIVRNMKIYDDEAYLKEDKNARSLYYRACNLELLCIAFKPDIKIYFLNRNFLYNAKLRLGISF